MVMLAMGVESLNWKISIFVCRRLMLSSSGAGSHAAAAAASIASVIGMALKMQILATGQASSTMAYEMAVSSVHKAAGGPDI